MASRRETPDFQGLRAEAEATIKAIQEFDAQIAERNRARLRLLDTVREILTAEQFSDLENALTKSAGLSEAPVPRDISTEIEFDEGDALNSLRKIRCQIAQEVCAVMDGERK
jgi:hypothetical protein